MPETHDCPLCKASDERLLWSDRHCRVIAVDDPDYAGYCRVIWHDHVREMSDLPASERRHVMDVVYAVEASLRALMQPDKINLASFGNMVPHLNWHVIPRFRDDRHFPEPVWGRAQREPEARPERTPKHDTLADRIRRAMQDPT